MIKRIRSAVLLTAALTLVSAAMAVPVSAADPVAAYNGVCGSGYGVVNYANIGSKGTVFLTYNSANGNNCVVTVRTTPGGAAPMDAFIKTSSSSTWERDEGNYITYAGPVYLSAAGQCVDWGGTIGTATLTERGTNCG